MLSRNLPLPVNSLHSQACCGFQEMCESWAEHGCLGETGVTGRVLVLDKVWTLSEMWAVGEGWVPGEAGVPEAQ